MKDILKLSATHAIGKMPTVLIAAADRWIDGMDAGIVDLVPDLRIERRAPDAALAREDLRDIDLLVLEVEAGAEIGLRRLEDIRRTRPDLPLIVAVENADLSMMRALLRHNIRDVIALPFDSNELTGTIFDVTARIADAGETRLAPVNCFVGTLGRVGNTSIVLHLADAVARQSSDGLRCCVIDLDIQSGSIAAHAGVDSSRSILDLLEAEDRLDADMVRNVATRTRDGVYVISAPTEIVPIEQVDADQLLRIVTAARSEFDLVFLDMPPAWTNWSLSVAAEADRIVIVTRQTLSHLRQARRCLDLFDEVGIDRQKIGAVVNRAQKSRFKAISVQDVADTLRLDVIGAVREDRGELSQAIDEGKLVHQLASKNVFARDVDSLAEHFAFPDEEG